jgi:hydrogenase expression/formation protein HypD
VPDNKACECGAILRGVKTPTDCKMFGTVCTPENPMGSCMVSSEGACAAHYTYGRFRHVTDIAGGGAQALKMAADGLRLRPMDLPPRPRSI